VATGGTALSKIPVEAGEVLYLSLEDRDRRLQARAKESLGDYHDGLRNFYYLTDCPRQDEGGIDVLRSWLDEHSGARLLILDTLQRFRRPKKSGEDSYQADYAALGELKCVADDYGIPFLILHHTRKQKDEGGDFLGEVSGTQAIAGAVDSVLVLKRARLSNTLTLGITGRDVDEQELALTRDEICGWVLEGDAEEFALSRNARRILAFLRDNGVCGPKEISDGTGLTAGTIRGTLPRMLANRQIELISRGKYKLPESKLA